MFMCLDRIVQGACNSFIWCETSYGLRTDSYEVELCEQRSCSFVILLNTVSGASFVRVIPISSSSNESFIICFVSSVKSFLKPRPYLLAPF